MHNSVRWEASAWSAIAQPRKQFLMYAVRYAVLPIACAINMLYSTVRAIWLAI